MGRLTTQFVNLQIGQHDEVIQQYLSVGVGIASVVKLPGLVTDDETYAPLVIDGASGVGKSQQFFSLVCQSKQRGCVYLLPTARDIAKSARSQKNEVETSLKIQLSVIAGLRSIHVIQTC